MDAKAKLDVSMFDRFLQHPIRVARPLSSTATVSPLALSGSSGASSALRGGPPFQRLHRRQETGLEEWHEAVAGQAAVRAERTRCTACAAGQVQSSWKRSRSPLTDGGGRPLPKKRREQRGAGSSYEAHGESRKKSGRKVPYVAMDCKN